MICSAPRRGELLCLTPEKGDVVCSAPEGGGVVCSDAQLGEELQPSMNDARKKTVCAKSENPECAKAQPIIKKTECGKGRKMICSAPRRGELVCSAPEKGSVVCPAPGGGEVVCSAMQFGEELVCPVPSVEKREKRTNLQGIEFSTKHRKKKQKKGSLTDKNLGEKVEKDKIDIFDIFKTQKKENFRRKVKVKPRCNIQQKGKAV